MSILIAACSAAEVVETTTTTTAPAETTTTAVEQMRVLSPDFMDGDVVPIEFTCDGADVNPTLVATGYPAETTHLVVTVEDPDAPLGTWIHWVVYDIVVDGTSFTIEQDAGPIGTDGTNSWNLTGYGGPCPPPGENHRYLFKITALSEPLGLPAGADIEQVNQAMIGKLADEALLMGTYSR